MTIDTAKPKTINNIILNNNFTMYFLLYGTWCKS